MPVTDAPRSKRRALPARPWILLMVDDDPDLLEALGDLVEQELPSVKVLRATSGREALEVLQSERVDGIIADFSMDGMDGLQFLCIARQCHPTVPRIMLTAHPDPTLTQMAKRDAAVQAFLSKLVDPDEFLDQVCALLTYQPSIRPAP